MNLIQKIHALMVSDKINIWHYPNKKTSTQKFYYWLRNQPEDKEGHGFYTLDAMVEAAYKHIDPLLQPLPEHYAAPLFEEYNLAEDDIGPC